MIQPINILTNIYLPKVDQMKIVISEDEAKIRLSSTWTYGLSPRPSQGIKSKKNPSPEGAAYKKKDIAKNFQVPQMVSLSETPEQEVNNLL